MKVARVFPTKTSMSPDDQDSYFDVPDMFTPKYDEVHISVTFTWDIPKIDYLKKGWQAITENIKIGGVAIDGESKMPFKASMYLKQGVTITSRGCPNKCSFCVVKNDIIEFDNFPEGNILQDNNILACSDNHWGKVMDMLSKQTNIELKGGLESRRLTKEKAKDLKKLHLKSIWLACDSDSAIKPLEDAIGILEEAGISKNKIYCYVLIGKEELRLRKVMELGVMPFAQLYQDFKKDKIDYTKEIKQYARLFQRPAITRGMFKECGE